MQLKTEINQKIKLGKLLQKILKSTACLISAQRNIFLYQIGYESKSQEK